MGRRTKPAPGQLGLYDRLDGLARLAQVDDPSRPALLLFCVCLALLGLGLLIQASHAATTLDPAGFRELLTGQAAYRLLGLLVLMLAARIGPGGLRPLVPALTVLCGVLLVLVFVPPLAEPRNGSHRWVDLGVLSFQPSELARIVLVLWMADRCVRLGPEIRQLRGGVAPMLVLGLAFFALIAVETDLGGALVLLLCILATMWVGGARPFHVWGACATVGALAVLVGSTQEAYIRARIAMFLGAAGNEQLEGSTRAMQSGGLFGVGLGQGQFRNHGVPYLESDFVFAQLGEELGLFGMLLCLGLFAAFLWYGLQLVHSLRDRFDALASFGLLLSTSLQAMLHVQVVCGLAPPKGMTLPFISHGGTSLVVTCLGVGLALGAARRQRVAAEPSLFLSLPSVSTS
jgi:cell division protein FtsW